MRKLTAGMVGLAVLVLGAGLAPSPALAKSKCPKECKVQIRTNDKDCKAACTKHDKTCKQACNATNKAAKEACKTATNPTPPTCSPSGAFLP